MNTDALPNDFQYAGVHLAELICPSCGGSGRVQGYPCGICCVVTEEGIETGTGRYTAGCGGPVFVDANHPGLAECTACKGFIDPREVTATD